MMGEAPPAFDLLYWNGDGTNLPGKAGCIWQLPAVNLQDLLPGLMQRQRQVGTNVSSAYDGDRHKALVSGAKQ